jgi:flavin reductase (DIM6/NTAB) family NADH-FMN oxidoreductase RutF
MRLDFAELDAHQRYKLMSAAIVPRPIAWVASIDAAGNRNLAPYSFFNMMGASPPLIVLGTMRRPDGTLKDSARNIVETGDFIVHLVDEAHLEAMNISCIDAPSGVNEAKLAGIETIEEPGRPARIASAAVAFECRLDRAIDAPPDTMILLGQVTAMHVADAFIDAERLRLDPVAMGLVGRVHGPGAYTRIAVDRVLERPVYAAWLARSDTAVDSID